MASLPGIQRRLAAVCDVKDIDEESYVRLSAAPTQTPSLRLRLRLRLSLSLSLSLRLSLRLSLNLSLSL